MIALEVAAIALGALAIALGVRMAARGVVITSRRPRALRPARSIPAQLAGLEQLVSSVSLADDVHHRLRPVLREIAAVRLRGRGLRLDLDLDRARRLLGDELWEIVRPGRPMPADGFGPGVSGTELRRLIDRLEAL